MSARFAGGRNIALKVPPHEYDATCRFYGEVLGLERAKAPDPDAVGFCFGACNLWIDRVPGMSQAELWLEVVTDDTAAAARQLKDAGIARRDEIEPLGQLDGFWIAGPGNIIHLVDAKSGSWD